MENYSLTVPCFACRVNRDSKSGTKTLRTCFNAINTMAVSESRNEFPLEITFIQVSSFVSICVKLHT